MNEEAMRTPRTLLGKYLTYTTTSGHKVYGKIIQVTPHITVLLGPVDGLQPLEKTTELPSRSGFDFWFNKPPRAEWVSRLEGMFALGE